MRKDLILPVILAIIATILIAIGVSKTFALNIVSEPTDFQRGKASEYGTGKIYISQNGLTTTLYNTVTNQSVNFGGSCLSLTENHIQKIGGIYLVQSFCSNDGYNPSDMYTSYFLFPANMTLYENYKLMNPALFTDNKAFIFSPDVDNITSTSYFIIPNGTNLVFYNYTYSGLGSVLQTIPMPNGNFYVAYNTVPFLGTTSSSSFYVYQGTDGKSYNVNLNFTDSVQFPTSFPNNTPFGISGNDAIFGNAPNGSGSVFLPSFYSSSTVLLDTGTILYRFNSFENPKAYFRSTDVNWDNGLNTIVSYDLNCKTEGYDSCQLNGGVFKCTDTSGNLSPGGELCGLEVDVLPPPTQTDTNVPETCYDGIKNQDEVSVDYGGTCGGSAPVSFSGFTCTYKSLAMSPTPGTYGYDFGTLSEFSEDHFYSNRWVFDWSSASGDEEQYFEANGLGTGSVIYSGSLTGINANVKSDLVSSNTESIYNMNIEVFSFSGSHEQRINYIAFKTNKNSSNQGQVWFKDREGNIEKKPLIGIGNGIAIAYTSTDIVPVSLRVTNIAYFTFYGMEIGWSPITYTNVLQCDNTEWACKINDNGLCSAVYYAGKARGMCGFVDNKCVPTTSLEDADWSYATGGNPYQNVNQQKELDLGDDIFSCDREGFAVFLCPVDVASKIWSRFKIFLKTVTNIMYGISSMGSSDGDKSTVPMNLIGFLIPTASAEDFGKKLISPFYHTEGGTDIYSIDKDKAPYYTGADMMNINNSMFTMGDNLKSMPQGGIKGIFAYSQWMLLLIGGVSILVLFLMAIG